MDLLFIHQNYPGQYRNLAPALEAQGHRVLGLGATARPGSVHYSWEDSQPANGLIDADLERNLQRGARVAERCHQLRQEGLQPDAVFFHSGWGEGLYLRDLWPDALLLAYPELYANPRLLGYGFDPDLASMPEPLRQALRRQNFMALAAIADADAAVVPTLFQRDTFPSHLRSRFQVIHEGVDTGQVTPHPRRHVQLNPQLMLRHGDPVITFVNRNLEPLRGFRTFMRALPDILSAHPTAQVLIVGGDGASYGPTSGHPGGYRGELLSLLGHRLDATRVHFLGKVPYPQLLALFQISAVHVYFTYPYALSWSVLEAMACGALVLGSDNEPVRELIQHGRNGLLSPFDRADLLAAQVLDVLADPARFAPLAAEGRRTIEQRYELGHCARAYGQLVNSLKLVS
jgi:glycosyltransferase involved in cell wall biosynthesis